MCLMQYFERSKTATKGQNGKVVVVGGSANIHGAPILAALGALAADVDLVRLFVPAHHAVVARSKNLNLMVGELSGEHFLHSDAEIIAEMATEWADAVVIGCGFLEDDFGAVETFVHSYRGKLVLDAGALFRPILDLVKRRSNVLLTPHGGEFERMTGLKDNEENIQKTADYFGITILKKGVEDIVAQPGKIFISKTGCPQMAVGGTGDSLAGICGGLMARGHEPFDAAKLGAIQWGKTGEALAKERRVLSAEMMLEHFAAGF